MLYLHWGASSGFFRLPRLSGTQGARPRSAAMLLKPPICLTAATKPCWPACCSWHDLGINPASQPCCCITSSSSARKSSKVRLCLHKQRAVICTAMGCCLVQAKSLLFAGLTNSLLYSFIKPCIRVLVSAPVPAQSIYKSLHCHRSNAHCSEAVFFLVAVK